MSKLCRISTIYIGRPCETLAWHIHQQRDVLDNYDGGPALPLPTTLLSMCAIPKRMAAHPATRVDNTGTSNYYIQCSAPKSQLPVRLKGLSFVARSCRVTPWCIFGPAGVSSTFWSTFAWRVFWRFVYLVPCGWAWASVSTAFGACSSGDARVQYQLQGTSVLALPSWFVGCRLWCTYRLFWSPLYKIGSSCFAPFRAVRLRWCCLSATAFLAVFQRAVLRVASVNGDASCGDGSRR